MKDHTDMRNSVGPTPRVREWSEMKWFAVTSWAGGREVIGNAICSNAVCIYAHMLHGAYEDRGAQRAENVQGM